MEVHHAVTNLNVHAKNLSQLSQKKVEPSDRTITLLPLSVMWILNSRLWNSFYGSNSTFVPNGISKRKKKVEGSQRAVWINVPQKRNKSTLKKNDVLIVFKIKEMKLCCCSCRCTDDCPCKCPCDCSKCIWENKN